MGNSMVCVCVCVCVCGWVGVCVWVGGYVCVFSSCPGNERLCPGRILFWKRGKQPDVKEWEPKFDLIFKLFNIAFLSVFSDDECH